MTRVTGAWLDSGSTQGIFDAYAANGYQLFFVGGCVRNALLGEAVSDIDMCSDAPPDVASAFLTAKGLRVVPTGLDHGTLTVVVDGISHEITTFRKDVTTDGRRATVAFSTSIEDDARRRDFSINALYADRNGVVLDPLGGLTDIATRGVRFIEDPQARIREDYLRILRFFRFHARIAQEPPDAGTLDAIARNIDGLSQLSVERITSEMLKILGLPNPAPTLGIMQMTGVLSAVLPSADITAVAPLVHIEGLLGLRPDPLPRLAALGGAPVFDALRLSKAQRRDVLEMHEYIGSNITDTALGHVLGARIGLQCAALRYAVFGNSPAPDTAENVLRGAEATCPVKASDLKGDYRGAALGARLKQLKTAWLHSDLTLGKAALLCLPDK